MSELTVHRWKRHGKDRLYVNLPDGTAVAWADLATKVITVKMLMYRSEAVALLRAQLGHSATVREHVADAVKPRSKPAPTPAPPQGRGRLPRLPQLTVADDLAENRPGAELLGAVAARGPSSIRRAWGKVLGRSSEWDSYYIGLGGERRVGRELERLTSQGWRVLHGVPKSNGGDIDHLLIGPGGVFSINTKCHPGASVWVGDSMAKVNNGPPEPYAAASKAEAAYVREVLERHCGFPVAVEPVLVFVDVATVYRAVTQNKVRIYQEREVSALGPLTGVLTPDRVEAVYAVARHRRAWLRG
ncbi:nuclease-related domain-containing protein [Streptomyces sp. NPDC050738]|uniref:nuclease-related domain-containing protein n=1 Tax=Streptomyces sp. NPDC050738 TaxID=3154744 RepID=UPI003439754E